MTEGLGPVMSSNLCIYLNVNMKGAKSYRFYLKDEERLRKKSNLFLEVILVFWVYIYQLMLLVNVLE